MTLRTVSQTRLTFGATRPTYGGKRDHIFGARGVESAPASAVFQLAPSIGTSVRPRAWHHRFVEFGDLTLVEQRVLWLATEDWARLWELQSVVERESGANRDQIRDAIRRLLAHNLVEMAVLTPSYDEVDAPPTGDPLIPDDNWEPHRDYFVCIVATNEGDRVLSRTSS